MLKKTKRSQKIIDDYDKRTKRKRELCINNNLKFVFSSDKDYVLEQIKKYEEKNNT